MYCEFLATATSAKILWKPCAAAPNKLLKPTTQALKLSICRYFFTPHRRRSQKNNVTIFEISRKNCGWRSHLLIIYFILPNKTQEYNKGEAIIPQRRTVPSHPSTHRATVAPRTALLVALHRHRISASFSASRHATLCSQKAKPRTQFLSFHFYSGSRATSARRTARASLEGNTYTPAHALRLAPPSPPP